MAKPHWTIYFGGNEIYLQNKPSWAPLQNSECTCAQTRRFWSSCCHCHLWKNLKCEVAAQASHFSSKPQVYRVKKKKKKKMVSRVAGLAFLQYKQHLSEHSPQVILRKPGPWATYWLGQQQGGGHAGKGFLLQGYNNVLFCFFQNETLF